MGKVTICTGPYLATIWGGGVAVALRNGDHEIFWQGEEAADAADLIGEYGREGAERLWDDFSDLAQPVVEEA